MSDVRWSDVTAEIFGRFHGYTVQHVRTVLVHKMVIQPVSQRASTLLTVWTTTFLKKGQIWVSWLS